MHKLLSVIDSYLQEQARREKEESDQHAKQAKSREESLFAMMQQLEFVLDGEEKLSAGILQRFVKMNSTVFGGMKRKDQYIEKLTNIYTGTEPKTIQWKNSKGKRVEVEAPFMLAPQVDTTKNSSKAKQPSKGGMQWGVITQDGEDTENDSEEGNECDNEDEWQSGEE